MNGCSLARKKRMACLHADAHEAERDGEGDDRPHVARVPRGGQDDPVGGQDELEMHEEDHRERVRLACAPLVLPPGVLLPRVHAREVQLLVQRNSQVQGADGYPGYGQEVGLEVRDDVRDAQGRPQDQDQDFEHGRLREAAEPLEERAPVLGELEEGPAGEEEHAVRVQRQAQGVDRAQLAARAGPGHLAPVEAAEHALRVGGSRRQGRVDHGGGDGHARLGLVQEVKVRLADAGAPRGSGRGRRAHPRVVQAAPGDAEQVSQEPRLEIREKQALLEGERGGQRGVLRVGHEPAIAEIVYLGQPVDGWLKHESGEVRRVQGLAVIVRLVVHAPQALPVAERVRRGQVDARVLVVLQIPRPRQHDDGGQDHACDHGDQGPLVPPELLLDFARLRVGPQNRTHEGKLLLRGREREAGGGARFYTGAIPCIPSNVTVRDGGS